jgi:hypothetical protein
LPLWKIPNPLYALLVRWLDYDNGQLQDWRFLGLSIALNLVFTGVFIVVASRVLRPRSTLLYAAVLGAHPYLALYSLKLDTSLFALLPVGLLSATALTEYRSSWALLATALSTLLRNALLPMGWLQMMWCRRSWRTVVGAIGMAVLAGSTALQTGYGASYVGQNYGCYSLSRTTNWFVSQGLPDWGATTLGVLLTPLIHVLLDLGAREAVANHCLLLPTNLAQQPWLHLSATGFFLVLHGWLLSCLIGTVKRLDQTFPSSKQLLFPLTMLLPTLYGSAHMRYLIPIIPLLLLCPFHLQPICGPQKNHDSSKTLT